MKYLHTCKDGLLTEAKLNLNSYIEINGKPTLTKKGLVVSKIEVLRKPVKSIELPTEFYCPHCEMIIPVEEILLECSHCYEFFPVTDLVVFEEIGGAYCKESQKLYEKEKLTSIPVLSIIHKMSITGDSK